MRGVGFSRTFLLGRRLSGALLMPLCVLSLMACSQQEVADPQSRISTNQATVSTSDALGDHNWEKMPLPGGVALPLWAKLDEFRPSTQSKCTDLSDQVMCEGPVIRDEGFVDAPSAPDKVAVGFKNGVARDFYIGLDESSWNDIKVATEKSFGTPVAKIMPPLTGFDIHVSSWTWKLRGGDLVLQHTWGHQYKPFDTVPTPGAVVDAHDLIFEGKQPVPGFS
jgi:hypothetical protein